MELFCHFIHHGITAYFYHSSWDWLLVNSFIMELFCNFIHHGITAYFYHSSWDWLIVTSFIMELLCHFIHHGIGYLLHHSSWNYCHFIHHGITSVTSFNMGWPHISIIGITWLLLNSSLNYLCVTSLIIRLPDCHLIHYRIIMVQNQPVESGNYLTWICSFTRFLHLDMKSFYDYLIVT